VKFFGSIKNDHGMAVVLATLQSGLTARRGAPTNGVATAVGLARPKWWDTEKNIFIAAHSGRTENSISNISVFLRSQIFVS